jgi:transposase-like protein
VRCLVSSTSNGSHTSENRDGVKSRVFQWIYATQAAWKAKTSRPEHSARVGAERANRTVGGPRNGGIAQQVGMHHNQVAKWRRRYIRGGLGALQEKPRSGRKGSIGTEVLRQIVDQATRPPQGRACWTCRARWPACWASPRSPCSGSGATTKSNRI